MEEKATCNTQGQSRRVVNPRPYYSLPHPCLAAQGWGGCAAGRCAVRLELCFRCCCLLLLIDGKAYYYGLLRRLRTTSNGLTSEEVSYILLVCSGTIAGQLYLRLCPRLRPAWLVGIVAAFGIAVELMRLDGLWC